jgi:hypothetical protein
MYHIHSSTHSKDTRIFYPEVRAGRFFRNPTDYLPELYGVPYKNTIIIIIIIIIYLSVCHYTVGNAVLVTSSPCHFHVTPALPTSSGDRSAET